ncbi:hypothetical protein BU15DRAFT_90255 [Melanogaster broomeanus]|nr:hypothetical protein BU15DRAFT_90255 [Melanogaster broomeanus]
MEDVTIEYCPCCPSPVVLITRGLLACSPVAPSIAVDLRVLELVKRLFSFLNVQGYKLKTKVTYHWYSVLTICAEDHISRFIHFTPMHSVCHQGTQPSDYLRSRCPLCFGGADWDWSRGSCSDEPDCIVCLDACFTQKCTHNPRNRATEDYENPTDTVFVSVCEVEAMEDLVEQKRKLHGKKRRGMRDGEGLGEYEEGMRVPVSVLDGCGESFIAADEKHQKAKKQHYALALLCCLFNHLPLEMTVGLLYDIGCQLERSCRKWGLLEDTILSRLKFAISVFHAYGHQWPCQIIYHPRKCVGFGLSDDEGCERLWSSLKFLIPILQVSGHHQHLFILDNQIHYLNEKSLVEFGHWLSRKWDICQQKKEAAEEALEELDVDLDTLQKEWVAQVAYQTKPLPKQSGMKVVEEVEKILALEKLVESHHAHVFHLENELSSDGDIDMLDHAMQLAEAQASLDKATRSLQRRKTVLEVVGRANLDKMHRNHYIQTHMNALALKTRIQEWLQQQLQSHTHSSIKRWEPAILKLVVAYNKLCDDIHAMIRLRKAPHTTPEPPSWLANGGVRKGICLMLELECCEEEAQRLMWEHCTLQEWFMSEWLAADQSLVDADEDLHFHVECHKSHLINLFLDIEGKVRLIPQAWDMPVSWGPTPADIMRPSDFMEMVDEEDDNEMMVGEDEDEDILYSEVDSWQSNEDLVEFDMTDEEELVDGFDNACSMYLYVLYHDVDGSENICIFIIENYNTQLRQGWR